MEKYNLILLAGAEESPLTEYGGYKSKALIPVHERPMIEHVIRAFKMSRYIDNIVVIGGSELDVLTCMKDVTQRVFEGVNVVQNLLHGVAYVKTAIYRQASEHNGYLISFCDAVFLKTGIIDEAIARIDEERPDAAFHFIEKASFGKAGLNAKRTYIPVNGKHYTGSVLYYVRSFTRILPLLTDLYEMRKNRKDPLGILKVLGCEGKTMQDIERTLSDKISGRVRIFISERPELGMDVDKPEDLVLARERLKKKEER